MARRGREELEAEREANTENRCIIAGRVQRVPELEAPSEPRRGPETASEISCKVYDVPLSDQEGSERSWWRRLLGR